MNARVKRKATKDSMVNVIFVVNLGIRKQIAGKMKLMRAKDLQTGKAFSIMSLLMRKQMKQKQ